MLDLRAISKNRHRNLTTPETISSTVRFSIEFHRQDLPLEPVVKLFRLGFRRLEIPIFVVQCELPD
ncbi:MAG: hypothetical protein MI864_10675 [Pseudomonadales bacterium]|nr:hypothetical protein [Pseudomonadales bacterium]